MRFAELNLQAYGKFTDHKLAFPKRDHDFHIIIGPNEAGKSTLRRAITELLYGMELKSPLGFKHPLSDLRLAATLQTHSGDLSFVRTKQRESLRSPTGEALPDGFLAPALGALSEENFIQLHSLDHQRLLLGGQGIVDPRNSVSQILFQAASGIEGFAQLRDSLSDRALQLFAARGRSNEYAKAADRLTEAQKELRDAQVRTREWTDARDAHERARAALSTEREQRGELELARTNWERARRLAPLLERLARLELESQELGDTITFPAGAREVLETGIAALDSANSIAATRAEDLHKGEQQLASIEVDEAVLAHAADVLQLDQLCSRFADHARDLPLRQAEVERWLVEVLESAQSFGWGRSELEVRARLPDAKLLRSIDLLLKERGALLAQERSARESMEERALELTDLEQALGALPEAHIDPQLVQALALAQAFKSSEAKLRDLHNAVMAAELSEQSAMADVGMTDIGEARLRSMPLPSAERVASLRGERQKLLQAAELAQTLMDQQQHAAAELELKISQFMGSHKVVTQAEVSQARGERDEQWRAIKSDGAMLAHAATALDAAIRLADELIDARMLCETDGAELQAKRDQLESVMKQCARHQQAADAKRDELDAFDARWLVDANALGLAQMSLEDMPAWLARREAALQAAHMLALKRQDFAHEQSAAQHARETLSQSMLAAGLVLNPAHGLAALCSVVDEHITTQQQLRLRREALQQQLLVARTQMRSLQSASVAKAAGVTEWRGRWDAALAMAHLSGASTDIAEVEAAASAAQNIRQRLERIDTHRSERIDTMQSDLAYLQKSAEHLASVLTPEMELTTAAPELARGLLQRLEEAKRQSHRRVQAEEFLDAARQQLAKARSESDQAQRALAPLLKAAGVEEAMHALPLVLRAHQKEALALAMQQTRDEIDRGGDGLTLAQIQEQVATHPVVTAPAELMQLKDRLGDSDSKLTDLAQEELVKRQALEVINGGAQGANAEARRQEALADMSQASEDYLQHATASTLLKWAVDRYRERRQGPLLQRASAIFRQLTLGSFDKLRIDHDQTPPALLAYRQNNQAVKVTGLSDGTRDQLFLALRIAALELQADQGASIPFVADDLFINFDDARSQAGLQVLFELSRKTQVLFLSHQEHLQGVVQRLLPQANVIELRADERSPEQLEL